MEKNFKLVPNLASKEVITELPLSKVLFSSKNGMPWILLVPRRENTIQINHLNVEDQAQLFKEIDLASEIMEKSFPCDRLNVAAIGNKTPQLHVHIICRVEGDQCWPGVIWDTKLDNLEESAAAAQVAMLKNTFEDTLKTNKRW